jgi:hypothetical protein
VFEEVLRGFGREQREALQHVVAHVHRIVPDATEGRSYGLRRSATATSRSSGSLRRRTI